MFDSSDTKIKIETVPRCVAHARLQLEETGLNGNAFHAQTDGVRNGQRRLRPGSNPPRAQRFSSSEDFSSAATAPEANEDLTGVPKMIPVKREPAVSPGK